MSLQEHGVGEEVVKLVSQFIGGTTLEIQVINIDSDTMFCRIAEVSRLFI